PLIVCIGAAFGMKGAGAFVGLRPPGVPCGVGVGLGPVNWVRVVLKRISRFTMPTGATMSVRKPGILGNSAWLGNGAAATAVPVTLTVNSRVPPPNVTL